MATLAQVEEFRTATQSLVSLTEEAIRDLLSRFRASSNPEAVRDLVLRFFPEFVTAYGDTAAVLGADFYEAARSAAVTSSTVATVFAQPAKTKQAEAAVRWAIGSLFQAEPSWDGFTSNLLGSSQRLIMQPARETIDLMAREDARTSRVAAVSWSRHVHPERSKSGKSCNFCKMLAGRGPVYRSAGAAGAVIGRGVDPSIALDDEGNRRAGFVGGVGGGVRSRGSQSLAASYHDNCHCVAEPTFYTREVRTLNVRGYDRTESVLVPIN